MSKEIVIARYNEPLTKWLRRIPPDVRITVYDKGEDKDLALDPSVAEVADRIIDLPNVGREGHTYLHHIVANYDALADVTLFCQGAPQPHLRRRKLGDFFKFEDSSRPAAFMHLVGNGISRSMTGWGKGKPMPDHIGPLFRSRSRWPGVVKSDITFPEWWERYVKLPIPDSGDVRFSWHGMFSVTRPHILTYSLDYYRQLLQTVSLEKNPEEGHFLERAWAYIFNNHE